MPGEVGLRREEPEVGGALGEDRIERGEPRGEGGQLGRGEAGRAQAVLLGAERVVVLVDDHPGVAGQGGKLAEQLQVVLAERGELLLEVGGGRLVVTARRDRAVAHHHGPAEIVGADVDDDHGRVPGPLRGGDLRGDDLAAAVLRAQQPVGDGGAAAGEVQHPPTVDGCQVLRVGVLAAAAGTGQGGGPGGDR